MSWLQVKTGMAEALGGIEDGLQDVIEEYNPDTHGSNGANGEGWFFDSHEYLTHL